MPWQENHLTWHYWKHSAEYLDTVMVNAALLMFMYVTVPNYGIVE
jgi:hypothetical protein